MAWLDPPKGFSVELHMEKVRPIALQFRIYQGKTMSDPLFEDMLVEIAIKRKYGNPACLRSHLQAILPFKGEVVDQNALLRLGMFILEHDHVLKSGKHFPQWGGYPTLWVVSLVTDVFRDPNLKPGQKGRYKLRTLAMNGPPAGTIVENTVSTRYAAYFPKMLGVPVRTKIDVMPEDAIGMVFFGQFGAIPGKPSALLEVQTSSSMKTKNKQIFTRRHP